MKKNEKCYIMYVVECISNLEGRDIKIPLAAFTTKKKSKKFIKHLGKKTKNLWYNINKIYINPPENMGELTKIILV